MELKKLFKKNNLPLIINKDLVLFPKISFHLKITRESCLESAKRAIQDDGLVVVVTQKGMEQSPDKKDIYGIGVLCKIVQFKGNNTEDYEIYVEAMHKVKIVEFDLGSKCSVKVKRVEDIISINSKRTQNLFNDLKAKILELYNGLEINIVESFKLDEIKDPSLLTDFIAMSPFFDLKDRQDLLEELNVDLRMERVLFLIDDMIQRINIKKDENKKTNENFNKLQKKASLKKQLEEINKELGETDQSKPNDFYSKIDSSGMPETIKSIAESEIRRLESVAPNSAEYNIIKNYLEWLFAMPWDKQNEEQLLI